MIRINVVMGPSCTETKSMYRKLIEVGNKLAGITYKLHMISIIVRL